MASKPKYEQLVKDYFAEHLKASLGQVARALGCSRSTINKYKPAELKTPPMTDEELDEFRRRIELENRMYEKLSLETVKTIRDFNRYRLYPIEWRRVRANYKKWGMKMPFECKSASDFEQLLKEVCDTLYGWHLYEECPVCGKGTIIPIWHGGQRKLECGCSEYPNCKFTIDIDGESVAYRKPWREYNPPIYPMWPLLESVPDPTKIICLDVETTGYEPYSGDEILQLSIIDGTGTVLFDEYIKPKEKTSWERAEEVNGISPEMVQDKATIDEHIHLLNQIMENANLIVGYNTFFDLNFIVCGGVNIPETAQTFDVMEEFAPIFGEWDGRRYRFKYQKLKVCAAFYGYEGNGSSFHNSLEDARATMHCFYEMTKEANAESEKRLGAMHNSL